MKSLAPDLPPNGYGGWLAVLGTFQLLVLPILAVIELMATAASVDVGLDDPTPAASLIWLVQAVGQMIVVALGIYAAIQLRDVHPRALEMNGRFLAAAFVWSAICGVLPFAADIPDDRRDAMVIPSIVNYAVIVSYVVIWSLYLRSSKRMKATYGEFYAKLQRPLSIAQPAEGAKRPRIYWTLKSIPELSHLSWGELTPAWLRVRRHIHRHWEAWVGFVGMVACVGVGAYIGAVFDYFVAGAIAGVIIGKVLYTHMKIYVAWRYYRQKLVGGPDDDQRDGPQA
jgi:hypothetical protein